MIPDRKEIVQCIYDYFRVEICNYFLFVILALVALIVSNYAFKVYVNKVRWKAIVIVLSTSLCALVLIVLKTMEIIPVYGDYRNMSYTLEENCQIYIEEGMNNKLEQKNEVILLTENGHKVKLTITNDYVFETKKTFRATVVYTNKSKHIVWYGILD